MDGRFDADHEAPSGGAGRAGGGGGGAQPPHVNVEIPFADRMASWGKRALIVAAIVIILVGLAAYWWFHPPINIHSTDTWMFVAVFILLPLFLLFWSKSHSYKNGTGKVEPNEGQGEGLQVGVVPAGAGGRRRRAGRRGVAVDLPGQRGEVRQRVADGGGDVRRRHQRGELLGDPRHRPQLGHFAGQPRDGLHPRVRQPVRDLAFVQPDQLSERAGARESAGLRRPV